MANHNAVTAPTAPGPGGQAGLAGPAGLAWRVLVDVAALTVRNGRLAVLAVRQEPQLRHGTSWALCSVPLGAHDDPDAVARATLKARLEAAADARFVEQLRTYASPAEGIVRTLHIAYVALVADLTPAEPARVFDMHDVLDAGVLGTAHEVVVRDAIERLRAKLEYTTVATTLATEPFTIPELRRIYESVWGVALHPANFRRKVLATPGFVVAADDVTSGARARSVRRASNGAELYRRGGAALLHPAMLRPTPQH